MPDNLPDNLPDNGPGNDEQQPYEEAERFLDEDAPEPTAGPGSLGPGPTTTPPAKQTQPPQKNTVDHEAFDKRLYDEILAASKDLSSLSSDPAAPQTMPELLEDFFYAFYKMRLKLLEPERLSEEHARVNLPFVEKLTEDERTAILRLSTARDDMASALATLEAGKKVIEEISSRPELSNWIAPPQEQQPPNLQNDEDNEDNENDEDNDAHNEEQDDAHPDIPEPPQRAIRRMLRNSLRDAQRSVEQYEEILAGWGLSPGDLKQVPLADRLDIARRLKSPRLADFTELLGRMRNAAVSAKATGLTTGTDDVHSVTTGGPLQRVLPQEISRGLASGDPTLEADFYRRLAENSLLSYEMTSPEHENHGPIVAMIDASPSMQGSPMDWASALAAALAQGPAAKDGRPVHLLYFNTRVVKEVELAPYEKDPRKLLELTTVGTSGGTDYDAPLQRALQIADQDETYQTADFLLVTDGHCNLSQKGVTALQEAASKTNLSLYTVLCGPNASAADVERYATAVYHAERDLTNTRTGQSIASDLFKNI